MITILIFDTPGNLWMESFFGFEGDDIYGQPPRPRIEREWFDPRLSVALADALNRFKVIDPIKEAAKDLLSAWKEAKLNNTHLHLTVGLAFMHSCAASRGGSVIFPMEVLNFVNEAKLSKSYKYSLVMMTYDSICNQTGLARLVIHPESAIRRVLATATIDVSSDRFEQLVSTSLRYWCIAEPEMCRPQSSKPPQVEILVGACVRLALRRLGIETFSRESLRVAVLQSANSNTLEIWTRKLLERSAENVPKVKTQRGINKKLRQPILMESPPLPERIIIESAEQLLEFCRIVYFLNCKNGCASSWLRPTHFRVFP
jgi:flagellin-specific chaperone FliS